MTCAAVSNAASATPTVSYSRIREPIESSLNATAPIAFIGHGRLAHEEKFCTVLLPCGEVPCFAMQITAVSATQPVLTLGHVSLAPEQSA